MLIDTFIKSDLHFGTRMKKPIKENITKGFADRKLTKNEKAATIEQLKKRILEYTPVWKEHKWCVEYIRNTQ